MRTLSIYLIVLAGLLLAGCSQKELSKEEAKQLLIKEKNFPRVIQRSIFCRDIGHARMVTNAGLEEQGFVTVKRKVKMFEEGVVPIIFFSDKSKPYLLPFASKEDEKDYIRPVKLAEEDIIDILSIVSDPDHNMATVNYTTSFKNLTPFAVLSTNDLKRPEKENTSIFALSDDGNWILQK